MKEGDRLKRFHGEQGKFVLVKELATGGLMLLAVGGCWLILKVYDQKRDFKPEGEERTPTFWPTEKPTLSTTVETPAPSPTSTPKPELHWQGLNADSRQENDGCYYSRLSGINAIFSNTTIVLINEESGPRKSLAQDTVLTLTSKNPFRVGFALNGETVQIEAVQTDETYSINLEVQFDGSMQSASLSLEKGAVGVETVCRSMGRVDSLAIYETE